MAEDNPAELVIDADRQATKYSPQDAEENLDDRTIPEVHFKTSRLSVRTDSSEIRMNTDSTVNMESAAPQQGTGTPPTVPNLGRPQSAPMSKHQQKQFFAYRPGAIEAAVNECKPVIKQDVDGEIRGVWLLTEIDHWDNEKERLVLLNDNSLLSIKYDFVACKLIESKRIMLKIIDKVTHGLFEYPDKTIATPRDGTGIRAYWNKGVEPSVAAKWNPWSKQIPWITFTSHPLQFKEDRDTDCYKIDTFKPAFVQAIQNVQESKSSEGATALSVLEAPLFIDNYVGFASLVHNQSHLGFSRERGGISF
ncbi:tumor protein p63-regulated gene 1-like protein isoform X2 [Ptychodera flava]|uniref:tumor protein p63-regulated gene 1-like protein isoform X2 n=1 Tax=Ptychodera flava TaxID=63121 RepID=UPI00396A77AA